MLTPQAEYARRLEAAQRNIESHERRHIHFGNAKLAIIVAGLVLAWLSLYNHWFSAYWLLAPVAIYIALALVHERAIHARGRAEKSADFYRRGIARIDDRWAGNGEHGERFRDSKHTYADDLDLFGRGGLFELLSTCRTSAGETHLADWLLSPSDLPTILERQNTVDDLRQKLDLREQIFAVGEDLRPRLDTAKLVRWAEGAPTLTSTTTRALAAVFAVATLAAGIYALATLDVWPFLILLVLEWIACGRLQDPATTIVSTVSCNADGLTLLSELLERIENEPFTNARLNQLAGLLKTNDGPASHVIRKLAHILYWIDARQGVRALFLDRPLLYTVQLGFAADSWRKRWGGKVRGWIDALGELEALLSIAAYSFEHPADPFPEFADAAADNAPFFHGTELGHPLIASSQCVRNNVRLDGDTRVVLVSGSNMSGKSTLLRTVGINTVLAMAGAPIRGTSLRLSPIHLGTSIRTADSLQEGRSAFYTEILRMKQVFELTGGQVPVLFLFDEMLEGTNSHDRRIGAEGLVRAFIERRAIGIVTTHDLALTEIAASLPGGIRNMHLQDYVENGAMRFDYKLRDGVVTKSNALDLMRMIGLDV